MKGELMRQGGKLKLSATLLEFDKNIIDIIF
jgi:hypothetical protein